MKKITCPFCGGSGKYIDLFTGEEICDVCDGERYVWQDESNGEVLPLDAVESSCQWFDDLPKPPEPLPPWIVPYKPQDHQESPFR